MREALRRGISRGHVTLTARVDRAAADRGLVIDEERFATYVERLRGLQNRFGLAEALDLATVLRLPDVLVSDESGGEGNPAELVAIVDRAVGSLDEMRRAEGDRLSGYLLERLALIEQAVGRIAERAPVRLLEQRERLRQSVRELVEGVAVDEQRLAQEIAIMADRLDVSEEIARFRSHFAAFRDTLREGGTDGVGKRLGFLLQEMLREANTTGSKASDAAILRDVIAIKEELERIREQVENLE